MFKLFARQQTQPAIKDFYDVIGSEASHELTKVGVQDITLKTIVGSVGRAEELDHKFCSKHRGWSERHQRLQAFMRQGKPLPPIKVFMVTHDDTPEYYIVDGHHRVAAALRMGYAHIHAEVTEVRLSA